MEEFTYGRTHTRTDAQTNGQTDTRRHNAMTIARWPSASGANKPEQRETKKDRQTELELSLTAL